MERKLVLKNRQWDDFVDKFGQPWSKRSNHGGLLAFRKGIMLALRKTGGIFPFLREILNM